MKLPSVRFLPEVFLRKQSLFAQDSIELHLVSTVWQEHGHIKQWHGACLVPSHLQGLPTCMRPSFSSALPCSVFVGSVKECFSPILFPPHRKEKWRREGKPSAPSSQQAGCTHLPARPLWSQSHGWKPGHHDSPGVRSVHTTLSLGCVRGWSCGNGVLLLDAQKIIRTISKRFREVEPLGLSLLLSG